MHIMEGYLPIEWCIFWAVISVPFILIGLWQMKKLIQKDRKVLPLMAVCGAFVFVLSALKIPSVTGSCSHPTGTGLSSAFFGPFVTSVLGTNRPAFPGNPSCSRRTYHLRCKRLLDGNLWSACSMGSFPWP